MNWILSDAGNGRAAFKFKDDAVDFAKALAAKGNLTLEVEHPMYGVVYSSNPDAEPEA